MTLIEKLVGGLAEWIHPGMPREGVLGRFVLPTDISPDDARRRLKEAAAARGLDFNSAHDLAKLSALLRGCTEEAADQEASLQSRTQLAIELGRPEYRGSKEDNAWLRQELFKAVEQRGIPLPT